MKRNINIIPAVLLFLLVLLMARQGFSSDCRDSGSKQCASAAIFNDIMQTLPDTMKARVDSASAHRRYQKQASALKAKPSSDSHSSTLQGAAACKEGSVNSLPDDVRDMVEKAINDIDQMNQDRQIQFKEYEKKHPGTK